MGSGFLEPIPGANQEKRKAFTLIAGIFFSPAFPAQEEGLFPLLDCRNGFARGK